MSMDCIRCAISVACMCHDQDKTDRYSQLYLHVRRQGSRLQYSTIPEVQSAVYTHPKSSDVLCIEAKPVCVTMQTLEYIVKTISAQMSPILQISHISVYVSFYV